MVAKLHKAVDEVRAKEAKRLVRNGFGPVLTHRPWCFLKPKAKMPPTQDLKRKEVTAVSIG
jgi:transposase